MPSSPSSSSSSSSSSLTKQQLRAASKAAREHIAAQALKTRVRGIYTAQKNRGLKHDESLDYEQESLLGLVEEALPFGCCYCNRPIAAKTFTIDHAMPIARGGSFGFHNLRICCKPCNYQKGKMLASEFYDLLDFLRKQLSEPAAEDIKRRLTVGGRWSPK